MLMAKTSCDCRGVANLIASIDTRGLFGWKAPIAPICNVSKSSFKFTRRRELEVDMRSVTFIMNIIDCSPHGVKLEVVVKWWKGGSGVVCEVS